MSSNLFLFACVLIAVCCGGVKGETRVTVRSQKLSERKDLSANMVEVLTRYQSPLDNWGYENVQAWASIAPTCGSGLRQSPINIQSQEVVAAPEMDPLEINYEKAIKDIEVINNGHTIEVELTEEAIEHNYITGGPLFNNKLKLVQFHLHSQSEHTIDGVHTDLELHMVHSSSYGDFAVLSFMFQIGQASPLFAQYFDNLPPLPNATAVEAPKTFVTKDFDLTTILPKDKTFMYYPGSLTTPECSEVVHWFVFKEKLTLSQQQFNNFKSVISFSSNRPTQPLNQRQVQLFVASTTSQTGVYTTQSTYKMPTKDIIILAVGGTIAVLAVGLVAFVVGRKAATRNNIEAGMHSNTFAFSPSNSLSSNTPSPRSPR